MDPKLLFFPALPDVLLLFWKKPSGSVLIDYTSQLSVSTHFRL